MKTIGQVIPKFPKYKLPKNAPKAYQWYEKNKFIPWAIWGDSAFKKLTDKEREVYLEMCRSSRLMALDGRKHRRRYCRVTNEILSKWTGLSYSTVQRAIKKVLNSRLVLRHYRGTQWTGWSVYEIPNSQGQILNWRISYSSQKQKRLPFNN